MKSIVAKTNSSRQKDPPSIKASTRIVAPKAARSRQRHALADNQQALVPKTSPIGLGWDEDACRAVIEQLWKLRQTMLDTEKILAPQLDQVHPNFRAGARNFAHYLAFRRTDWRQLQEWLAWAGLSSLGRGESHVLANLDKVIGLLHRLSGQSWQPRSSEEPAGIRSSRKLLQQHTERLLGPAPPERSVRIMVTISSEGAMDYGLIRQLVDSGMDVARINCAHDGPQEWKAMVANVRRAAKAVGRSVKILMDLGGPKLRTGPIAAGPTVLRLRPQRDVLGHVVKPAKLRLCTTGGPLDESGSPQVIIDRDWFGHLTADDSIHLTDARGAKRTLRVVQKDEESAVVECDKTVYLVPATQLRLRHRKLDSRTRIAGLPSLEGSVHLTRGQILRIARASSNGRPDNRPSAAETESFPSVSCTLPEVFEQVTVGERIWFDDGRIGGVIRAITPKGLEVEITHARDGGEKLGGDKGINLPDSRLHLPALTEKDIADLEIVAKEADLVGLSFVHRAADVDALRARLRDLGAPNLGIVLKIETRGAFEHLPELLYSAMAGPVAGVMIARGDLAVECGYERLAEVQEEILWAAEAAHMPVIWATQVLETMAKTGFPSRAEITDAAMGERAECVMLNKGPYITDAIRALDDILRRMQSHQMKKRTLLRALHAWAMP